MRLYLKLALMALLAIGAQALVASGALGETYFAVRCYAANALGDTTMEQRLVCECERQFAAQNSQAMIAVTYQASVPG
jgi:hypothetical protein